ncbi:MAG: DNA-processing protein DprA [Treponema sp.]|nr:DNA-processing protein DprA [Treponema sp.]
MDLVDIALSSLSFLTLKEKILLKKNIDSLDSLAVLSIKDISSIIGRVINRSVWNGRETSIAARKGASIMESQHIHAVYYKDCNYPALLREIINPPYMLFYRGNIISLQKECVSVVGTRNVCKETAQSSFEFARDAACDGVTVVSGNAIGIDCFAHKGALSSGMSSSTVAILPCGIDTIVPHGHKVLVQKILESDGLVASEYIPGCPAVAWRFVQRNRLIAALSLATVVMQAPPGSGALITASFALDYNRDVVFHKSGFCSEALKISDNTEKRLRADKKNEKKLARSSHYYIEAGAPVISSYAEYKTVKHAAPGTLGMDFPGQLSFAGL